MNKPLSPAMEAALVEVLETGYDVPLVVANRNTERALIVRGLAQWETYRSNSGRGVSRVLLTETGLARAKRLLAKKEGLEAVSAGQIVASEGSSKLDSDAK